MKIRHWAMAVAMTGGIAVLTIAVSNPWGGLATPEALETAGEWAPEPVKAPAVDGLDALTLTEGSAISPPAGPQLFAPVLTLAPEDLFTSWSGKVATGGTLDSLLMEAGLNAALRAEVALAIGAEFDLRRLRPGHTLTVNTTLSGGLHADIPARFAVDLAQMLGGTVDFRRELQGGETPQVLWREARLDDMRIGQPEITYAALDLGHALYEVVWPEDGTGQATIYVNGELLRVFVQPVDGARVSSVFGQRRHPIYGNVRMNTGVDFAAPMGTPVHATALGQISFVGWRGGYGRVVEIAHGADTMTRYTHLSAYRDGLAVGQRVSAGDVIGNVGASGTATGPNMHYEVHIDGNPIDPLTDDRLAAVIAGETHDPDGNLQ